MRVCACYSWWSPSFRWLSGVMELGDLSTKRTKVDSNWASFPLFTFLHRKGIDDQHEKIQIGPLPLSFNLLCTGPVPRRSMQVGDILFNERNKTDWPQWLSQGLFNPCAVLICWRPKSMAGWFFYFLHAVLLFLHICVYNSIPRGTTHMGVWSFTNTRWVSLPLRCP